MKFDELWATLPIPFGYEHMDELDQSRWKAVVEAAFRTGLFEGTHNKADMAAGGWAKSDHMQKGAKAHFWRAHKTRAWPIIR